MLNVWLSSAALLPFSGYQFRRGVSLLGWIGIGLKFIGEALILYSASAFFAQRRLLLFYPLLFPRILCALPPYWVLSFLALNIAGKIEF
jgi:hypothetical protein